MNVFLVFGRSSGYDWSNEDVLHVMGDESDAADKVAYYELLVDAHPKFLKEVKRLEQLWDKKNPRPVYPSNLAEQVPAPIHEPRSQAKHDFARWQLEKQRREDAIQKIFGPYQKECADYHARRAEAQKNHFGITGFTPEELILMNNLYEDYSYEMRTVE